MKTAEFGQPCRAPAPGKCRICGATDPDRVGWANEFLCGAEPCVKAAKGELTVRFDTANLTRLDLEPYRMRVEGLPGAEVVVVAERKPLLERWPFSVEKGSQSSHCCFEATVIDDEGEHVCECFYPDDAEAIAAALNAAAHAR